MMKQMMEQMMEQMPFGKMPSFGEMPFGKMPSFDEMPFGKMPLGEMQDGKQMMDSYKTMFSNVVNAMDKMHEQNEKMIDMFLDNLPEQGTEPIRNLIQTAKKEHNELKKMFDDSIKKMEGVFDVAEKAEPDSEKAEPTAKKKTKK